MAGLLIAVLVIGGLVYLSQQQPAAAAAPSTADPIAAMLPGDPHTYDQTIVVACNQAGLADPIWHLTVKAIIGKESGFSPGKIGDAGFAFGLMQINTRFYNYDSATLLDPQSNIVIGCQILADKQAQWADWAPTVRAYNGCVLYPGGPGVSCDDPRAWNGYVKDVQARLAPLASQAGLGLPAA